MIVNNYTATEIGDSFIARLKDSYSNVIRVLDWNILVGVSNPNTIGTLSLVAGSSIINGIGTNLNLNTGDTFIVGNLIFTVDQVISSTQFSVIEEIPVSGNFKFYLPENSNNYFTYQYRWSQNASLDGGQMSEFRELNKTTNPNDLLGKTFNDQLPLWIDIRLEVDRLTANHTISLISLTFELETSSGIIESCPNWCDECSDPYAMDGCANIVIDCESPMWNPYDVKKPSSIYRQLSALANQMWGHDVKYFRVEPDQRSRDVILMEYSLYNVVAESTIKVIVPDNQFPTREFNFDMFGIGFEEFEVHVTGEAFTNAFGVYKEPRSRDYLYFPLINRMYEVSSVSLADEFNLTMTYWRVKLRKYEDRTSSIHIDSDIEQEVDDLIVGVEEIFGEEIQQEYTKVTKPQQFKTVYQELEDEIRFSKHPSLVIQDAEIRNRWTIVSKNNYQLDRVDSGERFALTYTTQSELTTLDNLAITGWIRPQFTSTDSQSYIVIDGRSENNLDIGLAVELSRTNLNVIINGSSNNIVLPSTLDSNVWYGIVVNLNNNISELGVHLYRLDPNSNRALPHQKTDTITDIAHEVINLGSQVEWNAGKGWSLSASPVNLTNLRLFTKVIELEQHKNVLQQYVVRDAELSILTDNAIPSIRLRKYSNPR